MGPAGDDREPRRRQRQPCRRGGRLFGSRRLHDVHRRRLSCGQSVPVSEAHLRPDRRFHAGLARRPVSLRHGGAQLLAWPVEEFIAHAKTKKLSFASPGYGTAPHLAGELFKRVAGIELTVIPYRGAAPAIQDVIPGRVDVFFNNIAPLISLMQQNQLRVLAVTTAKRSPAAPDVPTLAESGMAGFDVAGWYAFFVPAKTPQEIVRKMHADTVAVLAEPAIKKRLEDLGLFVIGSTPDQLGHYLKAEMDKWGPVIKEAGISVRE